MRFWFGRKATPAMADVAGISAVLESALGEQGPVFHEINSPVIHLDVLVFASTAQRDTYVLVTCGMSALPMPASEGEGRFMELCIELPADWPLTAQAFKDECNYWPIRLLKDLGRFPHIHNTVLGMGHTIANGDPPRPYASNTNLCCALLVPPLLLPQAVRELPLAGNAAAKPGETATLLQVVPIHRHEMEFRLKNGFPALMDRLVSARDGIGLYVEVDRSDYCVPDSQVQ